MLAARKDFLYISGAMTGKSLASPDEVHHLNYANKRFISKTL